MPDSLTDNTAYMRILCWMDGSNAEHKSNKYARE